MKQYKTQVVIISDQMVPNVTPVMDSKIRPEKVILCASNSMQKKAENLINFFKSKKIQSEIFSLGQAYDFEEIKDRFLELATSFENPEDVGVNLTGGNKLMTIAGQQIFADNGFDCFYVVPERDQIITIKGAEKGIYSIADQLNLNDFFAISGYKINSLKRGLTITNESRDLFKELLGNHDKYQENLSTLNALAAKAENAYSLRINNEIRESAWDLLQLFHEHGAISYYDDKKIEFRSESDRSFCKGFWLEDYTYLQLVALNNLLKETDDKLQDFACSIEIEDSRGVKNEIDAAFLYNNTLYIIECKTAKMDEKGTDILYKIDTIRNYAGLYTKPVIATYKKFNQFDSRRAEAQRIKVIAGNDLNRLAEKLLEIIKPKKGE
ncbi:MAG: Card1-like endonuclease domain-containing protein [Lentisphaeria bacterium]